MGFRNIVVAVESWAMNDDSVFLGLAKMLLIIGLCIIPLIAAGGVLFDYFAGPQQYYSLNTRDWSCTHSHTVLMPMMVGKTTVLVPREVCDVYQMKGF